MLLQPLLLAGMALYSGATWTQVLILGEPLLLASLAVWDMRHRRDSSRRFGFAIAMLNAVFGIGYGAVMQNGYLALASAAAGVSFALLLVGRVGAKRSWAYAIGSFALAHLLLFGLLWLALGGVKSAADLAARGEYSKAADSLQRVDLLLEIRRSSVGERGLILTRRVEYLLRAGRAEEAHQLAPRLRRIVLNLTLGGSGERGHGDQQSLPFVLRWNVMPHLEAAAYLGRAFGERMPADMSDPLRGALSHQADQLSWSRLLLPTNDPLRK